jgi:integrase
MKKDKHETKKEPLDIVTLKGNSVAIYWTPSKKNGIEYPGHTLAYTEAGKRKRKFVTAIEQARTEARNIARQLSEGTGHIHSLTPDQVSDFHAADKILRQHPGRSLAAVVAEWAAANAALGGGSIVAACEAQAKANIRQSGFTPTLVADVYDKFLAGLERDGASVRYIEDCKSRMGQIKDTFRGFIHAVEKTDLENWINAKKISIKTRKNYRTAAVTLWSFAKAEGYLPRDKQTEAELLPNRKRTKAAKLSAEIGVYEPADLRKILAHAPAHLLPVFAIGAFAGLRSAELHRLTWDNIRPSFIQVDADDSKNAVKRHAPVPIALKEWLAGVKRGEADQRLCARFSRETGLARAMTKAIRDAGVKPVHNGLRHTFCSARVAETDDVKKTSREAGNTVTVILKHYIKVMTKAKAAAWFNVRPDASTSEKVVSFAA